MASLNFEGRELPIHDGDTVGSVLYRNGVRTFSRSFKYHRPRGLYCASGDCASCMMTVDGEPAVRSCVHPARAGQRVARANAWPSVDHDVGYAIWLTRFMLPVGFYYKMFIKPKWLWPVAEKFIRRVAGIGPVDTSARQAHLEQLNHHVDLCVVGAGVAGLSAAIAAAERGDSVVIADEGIIGEKVAPGSTLSAIQRLLASAHSNERITILERAAVTGVYEGPLVTAAGEDVLHLVHPKRVVVATGAVELHAVFPGSDLPGVWLGRGAARMAGVHRVAPGKNVVVALGTAESFEHLEVLRRSGVVIRQVMVPSALATRVPKDVPVLVDGEVMEARGTWGNRRLKSVVVRSPSGRKTITCDALVLSLGLVPRDTVLRQAPDAVMNGAGEVVKPGSSIEEAIESGERAGVLTEAVPIVPSDDLLPPAPTAGIVCICEDVGVKELSDAWGEGYGSTELLKRYTTTTMGPCQGLMCHAHLRAFVRDRAPGTVWSAATTARPPARGITLDQAAAGFDHHIEFRTALHDRHLELGAKMGWAGSWKRPDDYGDQLKEYWAVRRGVSIMDVGTLGKYRIAGPDATEFLERLYPMHIGTIKERRSRYGLLLNEAGYLFDDGMVALTAPNDYFVSVTSSGADAAEGWFKDWAETWRLKVHIINQTAALGAINVAGPKSRELIQRLTDDPVDASAIPYSGLARITVAGIPCLALRVGFTGELSFELHHPSSRSVELWNALLEVGRDLGVMPHGLEALKLLRLEKGHIIVSQDTDFDTSPGKVGMSWAVKMEKPYFVGKTSIERLSRITPNRSFVPIRFAASNAAEAPDQGAPLMFGDQYVGKLTSSRYSPVLEYGVALGWITHIDGAPPAEVIAVSRNGRRTTGRVVSGAFYDPEGAKLRA